ncbi:ribbon-helix-helix domain-containing protein [Pyrococcus kukulkanii]|uniref:ribbon-helix-helix domain-containing protein n=1 Tax=Pyrococcus kukulkanii TaxID=1609559 RepID=UPI00356A381E
MGADVISFSVTLPKKLYEKLERLVEEGYYTSKKEAIVKALWSEIERIEEERRKKGLPPL